MIRGVYGAVIAVAVALLGLNMAFAEGTRVRHAVKTVWMNEDNQHFYDGRYHGDEDMTVEGCRALVDKYADTGVCTGILFCVNMQRALYDSDVWERFKDQQTDYSYQRHLRLLSDRGLVRDSAEARFTGPIVFCYTYATYSRKYLPARSTQRVLRWLMAGGLEKGSPIEAGKFYDLKLAL